MRNFIQNLKFSNSQILMRIYNAVMGYGLQVMGEVTLDNVSGMSRERIENGSRNPLVLSRITSTKPVLNQYLTPLARVRFATNPILSRLCVISLILMMGTMNVWGADVTTSNVYSPVYAVKTVANPSEASLTIGNKDNTQLSNGDYVFTDANGVTFTLDLSGGNITYDGNYLNLGDGARKSRKSANLSWTVPTNYIIKVTKIILGTEVRAGNTANCNIGAEATGSNGTSVNTIVWANTDVTKEDKGGLSSPLLIDYYYADSYTGYSRNTRISSIKVSYELTYNANIFGFAAAAVSNNEDYGTASFVLTKDSIHAGPGATSASTTATYTATVEDEESYRFMGWYSEEGLVNQVSTSSTYVSTLTNSTPGSRLTRTLYAKFAERGAPQVTCNIANSYLIGHDEIDLQSLWTVEEGAGARTYSIVEDSFTPSGENNDNATPPSLRAGRYLSFGQAGTLRLQMEVAENDDFLGTTAYKDVTITKNAPSFTWKIQDHYYHNSTISSFVTKKAGLTYSVESDNSAVATVVDGTLVVYNKPGTAHIRVQQTETYNWDGYDTTATVTPEWRTDTVAFTVTSSNKSIFEKSFDSENGTSWVSTGYKMGGGNWILSNAPHAYVVLGFTGVPDSLFFTKTCDESAGQLPVDGDCLFEVYESETNGSWGTATWSYNKKQASADIKLQLKSSTRFIKLCYYGTVYGHFNNIRVTHRKQFKASKSNLDFATNVINTTPDAQTFKFHHASAGYITSVASNNAQFTVSPSSVATGGEVCDSSVISVTYNPTVVGTHNGRITISDNIGNSTYVEVTGKTVDKLTPTITWPGETSFLVGSTIPNGFVAVDENGAAIDEDWTFASSDSTVIDIVDGELKAICGGTATISGIIGGDGTNYYKDTLEQVLTVTRNPDTFTWTGEEDEEGRIHVWADSKIPSSIATVNADTFVTYSTGNSTYLTVTNDTVLYAVAQGTVTLTANSVGDCIYNSGSDDKTIVIDPCPQRIVWEQTFNHFRGNENDEISAEVTMTAYAVDSAGVRTEQPITYAFESAVSFASINNETKKLTISALGRTRIIATAAGNTKYAEASVSKVLYARAHDAVCENDTLYVQGSDNKTGNDGGIYYAFKFKNSTKTDSREIVWDGGGYPGYVTLDYKTEDATQGDMKIEQYLPGTSSWGVVKDVGLAPKSTWTHDSLHLDSTATKLRVKIYSGNKSHYFRNVKVIRARFIEVREGSTAENSLTYSTEVNTTQEKTLRVVHSNINTQIDLTLSDGAPFTLSDVDIDGTCDGSGYSDITLTYKPVAAETNGSYTLTLTDGTVTKVITLTATATAGEKHVTADGNWSEIEWSGEPNSSTTVVVDANKKLTIDQEVTVYGLVIASGANVTVTSAGGLTVYAGGISGEGKDNISLKAGDGKNGTVKGKTGYLRVSPDYEGDMPSAAIELYSIAFADNENRVATWQYIGIPLGDTIGGWDICEYGKQFIYGWNEEAGDWYDGYAEKIAPFNGYCFTQNEQSAGKTFTFTGKLKEPETINIPLSFSGAGDNKGYHVLANSFAAPIDITRFESIDFNGVDGTIYLFNTGTYSESYTVNNETNSTTPGQYIAVTPGTAPTIFSKDATYPIMIPAMQGFCVQATKADASLKLDYQKLVWNANYGSHPNQPMRVAARNQEEQEPNEPEVTDFIKVTLTDGEAGDNLYLLASDSYDKAYENGFDAPKMMNEDVNIPNLFAVEDDRQLAIDATSDMESTFLGVRTGSATSYTLYFSHVNCETDWMLLDIKTNKTTLIVDGASYTFEETPNNLITNRFLIMESDGSAGTPTGTDEVTIQNKIQKFIYNDQLYILKDGVLYNACGMMIRR